VRYVIPLFLFANLLVNIDLFLIKEKAQVFANSDEEWYGIVINDIRENGCSQGLPVTFEHSDRKSFHTCSFFKVLNFISPTSDYFYQTIYLKVMAKCLTLLLIGYAAVWLFNSFNLGVLFGTFFLLDNSFPAFKPVIETALNLLHGKGADLIANLRYISPLQYQVPGILFLLLMIKVVKRNYATKWDMAGTLLSLVLLALTPFYTWLPYLLIAFIFLAYNVLIQKKLYTRNYLLSCLAILGIFVCIQVGLTLGGEYQADALLRSSFRKGYFTPLYLWHKSFILTLVIFGVCAYWQFRNIYFAFIAAFAPYVLLNINILTGYDYQNFHFKTYLALPIFGFIFFVVYSRCRSSTRKIKIFYTFISIFILNAFVFATYSLRSAHAYLHPFARLNDNKDLLQYLNSLQGRKNLFCGELYTEIPLMTRHKCYYHHLLMTYPLSNQELLEMVTTHYYLGGKTEDDIRLEMKRHYGIMATYNIGVKDEWLQSNQTSDRYSNENILKYNDLWLEHYRENAKTIAQNNLSKFDYLILKNTSKMSFSLKLIQRFKNFSVYHYDR